MLAVPRATFENHVKTKQPGRRRLSLLAMSVAAITIAAACGDDGGGATLEEYFAEVNRITAESDERIRDLAGDFSGEFENLEEARESYGGYVAVYDEFVQGIDALEPPSEAADAHTNFVATSKEIQELNKTRLESLEQAQDDAELEEIFGPDEEYTAALERQNDACVALRGLAEAKGIQAPGLANCEET